METLLTVREAAERKGVSQATIYKAIEEGRLAATRMLGRVALRLEDVDAFEAASYAGIKRAVVPRGRNSPRKTDPVREAES